MTDVGIEKKFAEITRKEWATIEWIEITAIEDMERIYIAGGTIHNPADVVRRYAEWEEARLVREEACLVAECI